MKFTTVILTSFALLSINKVEGQLGGLFKALSGGNEKPEKAKEQVQEENKLRDRPDANRRERERNKRLDRIYRFDKHGNERPYHHRDDDHHRHDDDLNQENDRNLNDFRNDDDRRINESKEEDIERQDSGRKGNLIR